MWRWVIVGVIVLVIVIGGFSLLEGSSGGDVSASAVLPAPSTDLAGYDRAIEPYDWRFPQDFGAHPTFQTEWWYYTGNLADEDGRRFGYQFTIFRRAVTPESVTTDSEWRSNQLYMAHFTVSDIQDQQFFHEQRFSREGAGLAGATCEPRCHVWLQDWSAEAQNDEATLTRIQAAGENFAVDFLLEQIKPPALQGDEGLSAKSEAIGNASYYYSLTRMPTTGAITINGDTFTVEGATWKDHEFSTSALGTNALGWDWFGLQLDDNRELMLGQIRLTDGGRDPYFGGILVYPDGTTRYLPANSFTIEATTTWTSPHTGATYPAGWVISIDIGESDPLSIAVTPLAPDQELYGGGIAYWEGAVAISGDASGYGYAELTGYADSLTGRF
jgi:predicted secreted hydrolase